MVSGSVENSPEGSKWIVEADRRDDENETEIHVGRFGSGSRDVSYVNDAVFDAVRAYMAAHGNKMPKDPSEVIPFLTDPSDPKVLQYLKRAKQRPGR